MNLLWQALASEEWVCLIKALLHTLWLGGLAAGGLYLALRSASDPAVRYRCCVSALLGVVLGGIVVWALLQQGPVTVRATNGASSTAVTAPAEKPAASALVNIPTSSSMPMMETRPWRWTPWLALVWLAGALVMVTRACSLVVKADRLRRRGRPLENEALLKVIEEAKRKLGVVRHIQVVVTEQLTSPAVMGWLTPVLLLPLSMVTTLSMEQLQLVLLHELAHIRRGDYLVNLCQLFAESLLFFNPAVWWISRQIRQEREVCCDAMAIALAGEPLQYARTLAQVAGATLRAAPAFADRDNPSGLKDRIQRLLVPGYRPALRLTWCALLAALFVGGGLLFLSAIGARVAVAAILTPQQRIKRIEKKITEWGLQPVSLTNHAQITISGQIRAADGSPVPEWIDFLARSSLGNSTSVSAQSARNGFFSNSIQAGTVYIGAEVTNFAPVSIGPLDGFTTNRLENLQITLNRGFDVPLQVMDADTGKGLADVKISTVFLIPNSSFQPHERKSGPDGMVTLPHCADLPMRVTMSEPGYEIIVKEFEHVRAGEPLRLELRRGVPVSGAVLDKITGQPIAGAELHLLYQYGGEGLGGWENAWPLGKTDSRGTFSVDQLQRGMRYYVGVSAPGHESVVLENVASGQSNLVVRLGPELVIQGQVVGDLSRLPQIDNHRVLSHQIEEKYDNHGYSRSEWVPLHTEAGVTRFQFTNRIAGLVRLGLGNQTVERNVDGPVADWVIDLDQLKTKIETDFPKREVIFRFSSPSGPPKSGTVQVQIPDNLDIKNLMAHYEEVEIKNGEAHAEIAIGGSTSVETKHLVGYWFDRFGNNGGLLSIAVTNGTGPEVIDIRLEPAGAIYAQARNADGTPAGGLFFGVKELKRAPGLSANGILENGDGFSGDGPRRWVSGPLPLGGTYQINAWRGNTFCFSHPITLTEANPDAEVDLQLAAGKTFDGVALDADGKPLGDAEVKSSFREKEDNTFGLKSVYTDDLGRFHLEDTTPELGDYYVEIDAPNAMAEMVRLDFAGQPQTIRLKHGRTLGGQVVQAGTGYPLPKTDVRTANFENKNVTMLTTQTDAHGRFEFNTLGEGNYSFYFTDGAMLSNETFHADGNTNLVLPVKLYAWSKMQPKAP